MTQTATNEHALPGIEPFCERPTLEPPLRWDRWRITLKLEILAKEGISFDILQEAPQTTSLSLQNKFMKKRYSTARSKGREIVEYVMRNSKTPGSTSVRKSKQRESCAATDRGNFAITRPSCLHSLF